LARVPASQAALAIPSTSPPKSNSPPTSPPGVPVGTCPGRPVLRPVDPDGPWGAQANPQAANLSVRLESVELWQPPRVSDTDLPWAGLDEDMTRAPVRER